VGVDGGSAMWQEENAIYGITQTEDVQFKINVVESDALSQDSKLGVGTFDLHHLSPGCFLSHHTSSKIFINSVVIFILFQMTWFGLGRVGEDSDFNSSI